MTTNPIFSKHMISAGRASSSPAAAVCWAERWRVPCLNVEPMSPFWTTTCQAAQKMVDSFEPRPGSGRALAVQGNVLQAESVQAAVDLALAEFGKIDGLINAAGGNKPDATTSPEKSFFDLPQDALRWVFDLNLMGTIIPSQIVGRHMAERKQGVILNVSSMNAFRPLTRIPAYSAAKAGVSNFTQWLAVHMAQEYSPKIRVNAIAPGFFLTEQNRFLLTDAETGAAHRARPKDHRPYPDGPLWPARRI